MHKIQHEILTKLAGYDLARYRDMLPSKVSSNLYSYHLKSLVERGYVNHVDKRYSLSPKGLAHVGQDGMDDDEIRQPKLITMTVLLNERNEVYLTRRSKQPFLDSWNLPGGRVHVGDVSVAASAQRGLHETTGAKHPSLSHVGEASIRVLVGKELVSAVFVHVFAGRINSDDIQVTDHGKWTSSSDRQRLMLSPAISEIIDTIRSAQHMPFFEEYTVDWED